MRPVTGPRRIAQRGEATTRRIDGYTVETVFEGHVTGATVERCRGDVQRLADAQAPRYWLVDTLAVTGYDAGVRGPGSALLEGLRQRGAHAVVGVVRSSPIRMIASALGLAAGIPMKLFETRELALAYIAAARAA